MQTTYHGSVISPTIHFRERSRRNLRCSPPSKSCTSCYAHFWPISLASDGSNVSGNMLTGGIPSLNSSRSIRRCAFQGFNDTNCLDCDTISTGCTCEPCITTSAITITSSTGPTESIGSTGSIESIASTGSIGSGSSSTESSTTTETVAPAQTPTSKTDDALIGGIVGGIVGFLFLVGAVIAAVVIIGRRRRASTQTTSTGYGVVPAKLIDPSAYGSQLTSKDATANYSELKSSEI
jgi:hypothetical protein